MDFGFDTLLKEHWPIITIAIVGLFFIKLLFEEILPFYFKRFKNGLSFEKGSKWRSDQDLLHWLRGLHPAEFEEYVATLFKKLGYATEVVGHSGDHGIDVEIKKDGVISYIQCKKYSHDHKVGEPEVRNFLGSLDHKHAQGKGYFITTGIFTLQAEQFAEDKPIELIDGLSLVKYIHLAEKNNVIPVAESLRICPQCGGVLVDRDGKFGKFLGCANFPKCKYTASEKESGLSF